jgi:hypothetical protein
MIIRPTNTFSAHHGATNKAELGDPSLNDPLRFLNLLRAKPGLDPQLTLLGKEDDAQLLNIEVLVASKRTPISPDVRDIYEPIASPSSSEPVAISDNTALGQDSSGPSSRDVDPSGYVTSDYPNVPLTEFPDEGTLLGRAYPSTIATEPAYAPVHLTSEAMPVVDLAPTALAPEEPTPAAGERSDADIVNAFPSTKEAPNLASTNAAVEFTNSAAIERYADAPASVLGDRVPVVNRDYVVHISNGASNFDRRVSLIDLQSLATGKLSFVYMGKQQEPPPNARTDGVLISRIGSHTTNLSFEAAARPSVFGSAVPTVTFPAEQPNQASRHMSGLKETGSTSNLLPSLIAASFPEFARRKMTIINNKDSLDIVVRDYELSGQEENDLVVGLEQYFWSMGKTLRSLTLNGKQLVGT